MKSKEDYIWTKKLFEFEHFRDSIREHTETRLELLYVEDMKDQISESEKSLGITQYGNGKQNFKILNSARDIR